MFDTDVPLAESVDDLLVGATDRTPILDGAGKSGARLESVVVDGESFIVKYLDLADDWTLRAAGVLRGASLEIWRRGLFARLPDCINQPIVGVSSVPAGPSRPSGGCVLLMRDVGEWLVPVDDEPIPESQLRHFVDHMATMHATFWGEGDEIEVVPLQHRYLELSPWLASAEAAIGSQHLVPRLVGEGWPLLARVAPRASAVVTPLAWDPGPLVAAMETTPQTFVHGNWKLDNLGTDSGGRTVVLDWELPGRAPALTDLAWFLAINCRRLPLSKEDTIGAYRAALQREGIDTEPWWDRQLALCLLGGLVQFGWEKAFSGFDDELAWWEERALEGAALLR